MRQSNRPRYRRLRRDRPDRHQVANSPNPPISSLATTTAETSAPTHRARARAFDSRPRAVDVRRARVRRRTGANRRMNHAAAARRPTLRPEPHAYQDPSLIFERACDMSAREVRRPIMRTCPGRRAITDARLRAPRPKCNAMSDLRCGSDPASRRIVSVKTNERLKANQRLA